MPHPEQQNWHTGDARLTLETLETSQETGLSTEEVNRRLARHGPNRLPPPRGKGVLLRLLLHFHQPLIYILLAATAVTVWLGEWVDAGVIFAVVLINAVVGFLQESRAIRALAALKGTLGTHARVRRNGKEARVTAEELVAGDIVLLEPGDKVPADLRLLHSHELFIDESTLTGESLPVVKNTAPLATETILAERLNMAFTATLVTRGRGIGVVVTTGERTEIGRISRLIAGASALQTPLTRKIGHFSRILLYVILLLAAATFATGLWRGQPAEETFLAAVALAVAAIPEGLPAAFTIILAIGVARMARRNAIIRKLPAVETLGGTTVICSDKTGTLTVNRMTVTEASAGGHLYTLSGRGYGPDGEILEATTRTVAIPTTALRECLLAGVLCNDATLVKKEGVWHVHGDPTEGALLAAARKIGLTQEECAGTMPRVDSVPFESEQQYMATLHETGAGTPRLAYVKGAVEVLLARCAHMMTPDGRKTRLSHTAIHDQVAAMAHNGLRVLAFARAELPPGQGSLSHEDIASRLTFLGLQGMMDPPRPEAVEAVAACRTAGIEVKMITGDHAVTAAAIARQMRLDGGSDGGLPDVLTGHDMAGLPEAELMGTAASVDVFARVSPEQKLRLVQALQARGQVVAMTGDGVNDAPALKQADIGIAMGRDGTEVAKEAADMVLTDDNFATIRAAVEEGRCVFDNLTKFIVWTLPTNMGEALVVLGAIFTGMALPVLPVHILWVNMSTALLLGMMLAFERKEADIMHRPPRNPAAPILTRPLTFRVLLVAASMTMATFTLFHYELTQGGDIQAARTVAMNTIVFVEIFYLFNCRSLKNSVFSMGFFRNGWLIFGTLTMTALQLLVTYLPTAQNIFQTAPVSAEAWGRILLAGLFISVIVAVEKMWRRQDR